jgi:hypothetical protein
MEHHGNTMETGKTKKKSSIPPPINLKKIKARHLGPSYWLKGK